MTGFGNWRQLTENDLPGLMKVQQEAYPWHQEGPEVFRDRMRLYPSGCMGLDDEKGGGLVGYILSHPWTAEDPPALDSPLGALPEKPSTYYLHDLALLKTAHGKGLGARLVRHLTEHAGVIGFTTMSLIAVNKSAPFWERQGFKARLVPKLTPKLATYGVDAVFMTRDL